MKTTNNIPSKRGFKVPQDYFDTSREVILDEITLRAEVSSSNSERYDVPDGYFENSKNEMLTTLLRKLEEENTSTQNTATKVISLKNYYYSIAGVAAALLLLASIVWSQLDTTAGIESIAIAEYLDDETSDLEQIEFADWLSDDDIDALHNDIALDESVIIDYLDDRTDSYHFYLD
ncbi:hypothetical protein JM84_1959 [Dokdonia sp. Hel_I_63]|uniref:hypothetical protein n=1 Tax=Dokdonia sp. Hel_I_63 TaxID=1249996 RepID=UPI001199956D|nr:hypothetical protein [Dokdonia sp. Hel_I_63]TVZ23043.1 hypothetical protein JM84_1959 [Dokdonia sp. Hel_I_63]